LNLLLLAIISQLFSKSLADKRDPDIPSDTSCAVQDCQFCCISNQCSDESQCSTNKTVIVVVAVVAIAAILICSGLGYYFYRKYKIKKVRLHQEEIAARAARPARTSPRRQSRHEKETDMTDLNQISNIEVTRIEEDGTLNPNNDYSHVTSSSHTESNVSHSNFTFRSSKDVVSNSSYGKTSHVSHPALGVFAGDTQYETNNTLPLSREDSKKSLYGAKSNHQDEHSSSIGSSANSSPSFKQKKFRLKLKKYPSPDDEC